MVTGNKILSRTDLRCSNSIFEEAVSQSSKLGTSAFLQRLGVTVVFL